MSLYQMIYADVRARLGDSVNTGVSGVNNTFFPLVVDGDNNIPLFWDNGFNVSMISEGFQQKVWAYGLHQCDYSERPESTCSIDFAWLRAGNDG